MKLFNYYSLDECKSRDKVIDRLDELKNEGKIEYDMDTRDIFRIEDIDLDESEIEDLNEMFDKEEVFPYLDYEEDDEDDSDDYSDEDDFYDNY